MQQKQTTIQLSGNYKTEAHAKAMMSIAACLNGKRQAPITINEEPDYDPTEAMPLEQRTAYLRSKLLTQTQQEALESVQLLIKEIHTTAQLINQQLAIYELNLPNLELFELSKFNGEIEKIIAEAINAANKTGVETILNRLTKQREINQIRDKLNAQSTN